MEFGATWLTKLEENADLNDLVLWSDESVFKLNGKRLVKVPDTDAHEHGRRRDRTRHNCIYWSQRNPHVLMEQQHQAPDVCLWVGMWSGDIVGPYFFENTVTAAEYHEMLADFLLPQILSLPRDNETWFMQDGASSH
jgi:hypothetical protein